MAEIFIVNIIKFNTTINTSLTDEAWQPTAITIFGHCKSRVIIYRTTGTIMCAVKQYQCSYVN